MRLSEDKIKAGILHPNRDVRDAAAMYFSRSACRDTSILPLAIQAIEKYGWEKAFLVPPVVEGLPLSDETLPWVLDQLQHNEMLKERTMLGRGWHGALASFLWKADANLLARHKSEIFGIKSLPKNDRDYMAMRIDLLTVDAETCWRELEAICRQASEDQDDPDTEYGYSLVEAIARCGETEKVLSLLPQKVEDPFDYGKGWMEQFMVASRGRCDWTPPCRTSSPNFATPPMKLICYLKREKVRWWKSARMPLSRERPRCFPVNAGLGVHTPATSCSIFIPIWPSPRLWNGCREENAIIKAWLAEALTSQFAYEGIESVRQVILSGDYDGGVTDLRLNLIVAATLMEVELPEKEQWRVEVERDRAGREKQVRFYAEPDEERTKKTSGDQPPPKKKIGRKTHAPAVRARSSRIAVLERNKACLD